MQMSLSEVKKREMENALQYEVQELDKLYIRKLQKVLFECAAKCCDNSTASTAQVQYCIDKCNEPLAEAHKYVSTEMLSFQDRLHRCVSDCNDEAKDQMGASPSEGQVLKASKYFEDCASNCIDKHVASLPQFTAKVHEVMKKKVAAVTGT